MGPLEIEREGILSYTHIDMPGRSGRLPDNGARPGRNRSTKIASEPDADTGWRLRIQPDRVFQLHFKIR